MNYIKAETILPEDLLKEVQKYIQEKYLYIPCEPETRKKWGGKSGNREYIQDRNEEIRIKYEDGYKIKDLQKSFFFLLIVLKKLYMQKVHKS